MRIGYKHCLCFSLIAAGVVFSACSSRLGWGVLLWSTEDPPISSGTVLPVFIRSNINKVWVVGIPDGLQNTKDGINKLEIPLSRLELVGSRSKAEKRAEEFARYALSYAENLQDGLPIRDNPDNSARRVYRLRSGEIVKILALAQGNSAISATGDPLPGDWYEVLTEDGTAGYCFSYRLKLFEHNGGPLAVEAPSAASENTADPDLDMIMSKIWSPEIYSTMVNNKRINLEDLSQNWRFDPGQETGIARIFVSGLDRSFSYTAIRQDGPRVWRFEGANLSMQLRSDTTLAVQYVESAGGTRTQLFVAMPISVDDLVIQESTRRESLYHAIYTQGPVFTSNNYGTITFQENGVFAWEGYELLIPHHIPQTAGGSGTVSIDMFLDSAFEARYTGAFTMRFTGNGEKGAAILRCMYYLDNQGFRIEIVPESSIEGITVTRRAASPMVLYFFKDAGHPQTW